MALTNNDSWKTSSRRLIRGIKTLDRIAIGSPEAPLIDNSLGKDSHLSSEAGIREVCLAPFPGTHNHFQTVSNVELEPGDGMSDESGRRKAVKQGSFGNNKSKFVKSHACDDQPQTSETSNLVSACSSHDSASENADGKGSVRGCVNSGSCLYDGSKIMMSEEQVDDNHGGGSSRSGAIHGVHSVHRLVNESSNHVSLSNLKPTKAHAAVKLDSAEKTKSLTDSGGGSHTRGITRSSKRLGGIESVDTGKDVQTNSKVLGRETSGKDGSASNSASESNSSQSNSTSKCRNSSAKCHENAPNGHVCTSSPHEIKETKLHPSPDKGDSRRCSGGSNFEEEPMHMEKNGGSSLISKKDVPKTSNVYEKMSLLCLSQTVNESSRPPGVIDVPKKHGENESGPLPDKSSNVGSMEMAGTMPLASNEARIRTAHVAQNSASLSKNAGELIESAVVQVEPPSILFPVIASGTSGTTSTFKDSSVNHLSSESTSATQRNPSVGSAAKIHPYAEAEYDQDPNAANISTDRDDTAGLSSQPKQKDLPVSAQQPQLEGCTTSSSASEKQGKLQLSQPSSESDHSDSDLVEDDVKVCDICGDAGREEQLAVCSRCNDGAEHTYCMQVMLDKVPEGEWLCEECKSKENVESQKSDKSETIFPASRLPILKEKNKISKASAISKSLPKLDLKALDLDTKQATKPATPRLVEAEPVSAVKRQASDKGNGSPNLCSPNRKPSLLRESSFKNLDTGKVKLVHSVTSSAAQSANHPEEIGTYGCNSRMQSRLQSPRNKFSPLSNLPHKSAQFSEGGHCSSMASTLVSKASTLSKGSEASLSNMTTSQGVKPKPKVKQVLDEVPQKQLLARNSSFCDRRKEAPVKMLGKSASFKSNTNTVSLSLDDMKLKLQSQNLSHAEDLKSLKQLNEGASVIGRKNSFKLDHPMNGSSPAASTGNLYLPRSDTKALQNDAKTKAASDAAVAPKKDAEKTSCGNGIRKRLLSCHGEYVAPISNELDKKNGLVDEKTKILKSVAVDTSMGSENILVSAGSQVQMQTPSSFDDTSAVANSSENKMMEQNLQQSGSKEDNLIGSHTPDKSHSNPSYTVQEGLPHTRDSSNLETRSKELSPFVQSRKVLANGRKIRCFKCKEIGHIAQFCPNKGNDAGISPRASTASAMRGSKEMTGKSKWDHAVETALSQKTKNGEGDRLFIHSNDVVLPTTDLSNDLASKTPVPTGLGVVSAVTNSGGALPMEKDGKKLEPCFREMPLQPFRSHVTCFAIPEHHYIWQGSFEVQRSGKIADFCDGVQAHLSTCASPKVVEAANGFPSRVQLEEISRLSLWPVQFQAKYPTEDNIALYFFAKDVESYERDYKKLVENMLTNDLALKANVGSVELLIFTSDQLPDNSQRWNRLFFLWGVFRERKVGCLEPVNSSMAKPFGADRDVASSSKDFSSMIPETTVVSKLIPPVCLGEDSSSYRTPEASEAAEATTSLSLPSSVDQLSNSFGHNESIEEDVLPSKNQSSSVAPDINPNSHQMAYQLSANSSSKAPHNGRQRQSVISLKEGDRNSQIRNDMDQSYLRQSEILNATESSRALPAVSEMQEPSSDSSKDVKVICINQDQEKLTKEMQMVAKGKDGELQDSIDKNKDQLLVDLGGTEHSIIPIKKESSALDLRSNCKRQHVCFSEKTSKAYEINHEGSNCASINGEHESKRIKRGNMLNSCGIDLNSTFPENEDIKVDHHTFDHGEEAESSKTAERCFFSVDFGHVRDREASSSNSWPGFKNNNDDSLRSDIPNLELELGAGKQVKKGLLPLFLNVLDEKSCKDSHSDKGIDGADGGASSLSLSLAFPVPEKEKSENPVSASEKVFAEQPHVNTPLWLFGGCMDS